MANQMSVEQEAACGVLYIIPDHNAPMSPGALRKILEACRLKVFEVKVPVRGSYDSYKTASGFPTY